MSITERIVGDDRDWKRDVVRSDTEQDRRISVLEKQVAELLNRINKG